MTRTEQPMTTRIESEEHHRKNIHHLEFKNSLLERQKDHQMQELEKIKRDQQETVCGNAGRDYVGIRDIVALGPPHT